MLALMPSAKRGENVFHPGAVHAPATRRGSPESTPEPEGLSQTQVFDIDTLADEDDDEVRCLSLALFMFLIFLLEQEASVRAPPRTPAGTTSSRKRKADDGHEPRRSPATRVHQETSASSSKSGTPSRSPTERGLDRLASGLDTFAVSFRESMTGRSAGLLATPQRKQRALERLQREPDLRTPAMLRITLLFQEDVKAADTYFAITRDSLRKAWLEEMAKGATA
jgi:hypothetical protein